MPLPASALALTAFGLAAGAAALAGHALVREVEDRSVAAVSGALDAGGQDWARVLGDGLQVVIEGEAPDEASRFRAISAAGTQVDASRVIDNMRVAPGEGLAPPDFALEILRRDDGVSVIGLIPAATGRADLLDAIGREAGGAEVADLLQVADHPVPTGWEASVSFAVEALGELSRAKLSVAPGHVAIEASAASEAERAGLEARLGAGAPEGVGLALTVTAPRPVISPFALRLRLDGEGAAFEACAADTEGARDAILAAAREAGLAAEGTCRLGLGAPSPDWGAAAVAAIGALGEIGGGTVALSDADVTLAAAPGVDPEAFDRVAGELRRALPAAFTLAATAPVPPEARAEGPVEFAATLSAEGAVRLRGRLPDIRATVAAETMARARFGVDRVTMATREAPEGLPEGWSVRVLAGLDALSHLAAGSVTVTPDLIAVAGRTGDPAAREAIAARARETLGPAARLELDVAYDEALDPVAGLPSPEECLDLIAQVTAATKITFDPGSATLSREAGPAIDAIAEILRSCSSIELRIAGYTDSQGRESSNLALSQARAEAVLSAIRGERVPVAGFEAQGFGEADPVAPNDTETGREANRRIEFQLLNPPAPPPASGWQGPPPSPEMAARGAGGAGAGALPSLPDAAPPGRPSARPAEAAAE